MHHPKQKTAAKNKAVITWYTNATILTQNANREVLRNGSIAVGEGVLIAVLAHQPSATQIQNTRVVDCAGRVIIPGFVQTHVHLCQTLFRNEANDLELLDWLSQKIWPLEASHNFKSLYASALLGAYELLSTGTTCILDMATVRHTEAVYQAARDAGLRADIGKCLMDAHDRNPPYLNQPRNEALSEWRALYKKWHGAEDGRLRVSLAPRFAISCSEELLKDVSALSKETGVVIHTHASENRNEVEWVRKLTGHSNVDYLKKVGLVNSRLVLAHGIWLTPTEIKALAKASASVTHCPSSNLKLASGVCDVVALKQQGVRVALGADGAPCNNHLNVFQEMRLAALLQKVKHGPRALPAQTVFDMATRDGAAALGLNDRIGSIELGKEADFVVLDLKATHISPLDVESAKNTHALVEAIVYSATAENVYQTYVAGRLCYDRQKKSPAIAKAALEAATTPRAIVKRRGTPARNPMQPLIDLAQVSLLAVKRRKAKLLKSAS